MPSTARAAPQCLPIPAGVDLVHAAAIPETFFTVWTNVFERGRLATGESILIHGGSSGIGTTAIQLAHALGARVITTAGSDEKCAACASLGAEVAINYRDGRLRRRRQGSHKRAGSGRRARHGRRRLPAAEPRVPGHGRTAGANRPARRRDVADQHGPDSAAPSLVDGFHIASSIRCRKGAIASAVHKSVWPLLEAGTVRVPVHATFPLAQAAEAHRVMESSAHIGKLVLTV